MTGRRARNLRKQSTDAERRLWGVLRDRRLDGVTFRRQVSLGPYIADFACHEHKLVIEVDGGQHALRAEQDAARTARLELEGYRVLRFWNSDVLTNLEGVVTAIREELESREADAPYPSPSSG